MKWKEFESEYPKDFHSKLRKLCEEIHKEGAQKGGFSAFFCNYCYKREGWYCFPCDSIKKLYEERWGESLDKVMSKQS